MNYLSRLFGSNVEYQHVDAFLRAGFRETTRHDYKRALPDADKVAKALSSFANTFGGLLVVGVDQDTAGGGPILPAVGVDNPEQIISSVQQIANERVTPPVNVDFAKVQIPVGQPSAGKWLVLIRVPESHQAPHAVAHNDAIYVRRGDHASKEAEVFPPLKTLELLFERRNGPEARREKFWERSVGRIPNDTSAIAQAPRMAFSVGLAYPRGALVTAQELRELVVRHCGGTPVTMSEGVQVRAHGAPRNSYCDAYTPGFFFQSLQLDMTNEALDSANLAEAIGTLWHRARLVLKNMNGFGLMVARVELRNVWRRGAVGYEAKCLEQVVRHEELVHSSRFFGDEAVLGRIVEGAMWALGHERATRNEVQRALHCLSN